ncbi:hypothetical protein NKI20_22190 [Mesorhizobium sp. M0830]|uniref:hypothetical protein n=1 Tax=Mesorhizobium sp. M0830 TaxID=2957008 RepID=UPI003335E5FA
MRKLLLASVIAIASAAATVVPADAQFFGPGIGFFGPFGGLGPFGGGPFYGGGRFTTMAAAITAPATIAIIIPATWRATRIATITGIVTITAVT